MRTMHNFLPAFITVVLFLTSCNNFEKVNDVPDITFRSFTMTEIDTLDFKIKTGELVFTFVDGNADFGIKTEENPDDTLNLFLIPFKKENGVYDSIDAETYGRRYSVLNDVNMERTGQNKTIRGEIKVQVYYFIALPYDTIRYDFYIVDRAGNKSNVATTTDIGF